MSVLTYQSIIFEHHGIVVPDHLDPDLDVPIEYQLARQGDVFARREDYDVDLSQGVPAININVVKGDAVRNSHIFHCPNGLWIPGVFRDEVRDYGLGIVPPGELGYLTHTGEHGAFAMVSGSWRLFGQAEMDESTIRRVID